MDLVPPITKTDITTLTSFEINSVNVILNTSADILIYLKNSDNVIVASEMVVIFKKKKYYLILLSYQIK